LFEADPITGPHFKQFTRIEALIGNFIENLRGRRYWKRPPPTADGSGLFSSIRRPPEDGKHLRENPEPDEERREKPLQPIESGGKYDTQHGGRPQ